jgi:hypothetical protein
MPIYIIQASSARFSKPPMAQGGPPSDSHYWHYATSSNVPPIASGPTSLANHANYSNAVGTPADVGVYSGTTSPSGAFDMNGNIDQWLEPLGDSRGDDIRVLLGGRFDFRQYVPSSFVGRFTRSLFHGPGCRSRGGRGSMLDRPRPRLDQHTLRAPLPPNNSAPS